MKILENNSVEMTAKQLFTVTESFVAEYHRLGHLDSPVPTEEDIWTMLHALNFTVWLCPQTGRDAIKLLRSKYGEPESDNEKEARSHAHPI